MLEQSRPEARKTGYTLWHSGVYEYRPFEFLHPLLFYDGGAGGFSCFRSTIASARLSLVGHLHEIIINAGG